MQNNTSLRDKLTALRRGQIPFEELSGLIHEFGHAMFLEAEPDVVALLRHPNYLIRSNAVRVLTFHWDVRGHWDEPIRLLREDPDWGVRSFTAAGLGFVFRDSHDPIISRALTDKIRDQNDDPVVREAAYNALRSVWSPLNVDQDVEDIKAELRRAKERDKEFETRGSREEFQGTLWMWRQEPLLAIDWKFVELIERMIQGESSDSGNSSTH